MDPATAWPFVVLVALGLVAFLIRRRYGNLYQVFTEAVERATGLTMTTILRGIGILTLVVWALVYLIYGGDEDNALDQLFQGAFEAPSGPADGD
jgi:amino acid permease